MLRQLAVFLGVWMLAIQSIAAQQTLYPATQYSSFGGRNSNNNFATSPPKRPDAQAGTNQDSYRAMSPDSWEQGREDSVDTSNDWSAPPAQVPTEPTNNSSVHSVSFPKNRNQDQLPDAPAIPRSILPRNTSRYPLQTGDAPSGQSSILRMPAESVPTAPVVSVSHPRTSWGAEPLSVFEPDPSPNSFVYDPSAPVVRNWGSEDNGQKFGFEEKKREYPPMREILATGRLFGSATLLYLKPAFQGNTAIAQTISGINTPFDFDYEAAPQFQFGFESVYGPGLELNYWQYDESSNPATFTSDGIESGTTSVWMLGSNRSSQLVAGNNGDTLDAIHSIDVESWSINFFKELKFPISRLNSKFGYQFVSIYHELGATVTDSGGAVTGILRGTSDMRGWGPQVAFEYFRPIGHTKLEFISRFGGSALFGQQDQFIFNSSTGDQSRVGADEFLTMFDFMTGVQFRKSLAEKQNVYCRVGYNFQTWLGGGTAILPQDSFGLRGFSFTFGVNR